MTKLPQANKDLGQHFLRDQKVINSITSDWEDQADIIVEVGPGPAVLSEFLATKNLPYFVIEMDQRFKPLLEKYIKPENIFMQDALEFDWKNFISTHKLENKKIWLVSNLPYNVGTVLFTHFLKVSQIKYMSLMFQKEVGDKTYIRQEKNQMSGLLALSLSYFNAKKLCKVSPGCFTPPPKVDSVVVSYERKETPIVAIESFDKLNKFTRLLFSLKRKQIQSVLKSRYSFEVIKEALDKTQIQGQLRAEALNAEQVFALYNALN